MHNQQMHALHGENGSNHRRIESNLDLNVYRYPNGISANETRGRNKSEKIWYTTETCNKESDKSTTVNELTQLNQGSNDVTRDRATAAHAEEALMTPSSNNGRNHVEGYTRESTDLRHPMGKDDIRYLIAKAADFTSPYAHVDITRLQAPIGGILPTIEAVPHVSITSTQDPSGRDSTRQRGGTTRSRISFNRSSLIDGGT